MICGGGLEGRMRDVCQGVGFRSRDRETGVSVRKLAKVRNCPYESFPAGTGTQDAAKEMYQIVART